MSHRKKSQRHRFQELYGIENIVVSESLDREVLENHLRKPRQHIVGHTAHARVRAIVLQFREVALIAVIGTKPRRIVGAVADSTTANLKLDSVDAPTVELENFRRGDGAVPKRNFV